MRILILLLLFSLPLIALAQSQSRTVEGAIGGFTAKGEIEMESGELFPMARSPYRRKDQRTDFATVVFNHMTDDQPASLPLETLMAVGYADKVRLTIENGVVTIIDVLYIEQ